MMTIGIIIGLIAVSGIAAMLAMLLEMADATIGDYGECRVTVNDGKDLQVRGGRPLLATLAEEGIFLPSACGGKGTCAYCKVRVTEGGGPLLPTERPYLSEQEQRDQVRISCQIKVKEDLRVFVPEEIFLVREYRSVVESIERLTPDIKVVRFSVLDPPEGLRFRPGQYVQLQVPPYARSRTAEYRAYSLASSLADPHHVELVITEVEGGIVSTYVHERLKTGDTMTLRGPFGDFFLRESDRELLFVATGSGLAPIRAMLYQLEQESTSRKIRFFFGDRRPFDLLFQEEMKAFEDRLPDFRYVPTLSRVTPEDRWQGETGRVTDLIEKHVFPSRTLEMDVYICGAPAMVHSSIDRLREKGVPEERIYFDKFE